MLAIAQLGVILGRRSCGSRAFFGRDRTVISVDDDAGCEARATVSLVLLSRVFAVLKKAAAHGTVNLAEFARSRSSHYECGLIIAGDSMHAVQYSCSQSVADLSW